MMKTPKRDIISPRIKTVKNAIVQLREFIFLLDSIIIFCVLALVFSLLGASMLYAVPIAAVYFLIKSIVVWRDEKTIAKITHRYPKLNERLQTAYDNRRESNIITEVLLHEVSAKLDQLSTSSFFERKALSMRVAAVIALLFTLLAANFLYIQQFTLDVNKGLGKSFSDLFSGMSGGDETFFMGGGDEWQRGNHTAPDEAEKIGGASGGKIPGYAEGPIPGGGAGVGADANRDIYGAPTSVKIGGEQVGMEIHPEYGGMINIEDTGKEDVTDEAYQTPSEIESAGMPDQEPVEYAEVIKKYWEKLSASEVD